MEERRPTDEELLAENRLLKAQVDALTARVEQLTNLLEEKNRSGKRQAAPFSKGELKKNPEKPGRKSGDEHGQHVRRNVPDHVDEQGQRPRPDSSFRSELRNRSRCSLSFPVADVDQKSLLMRPSRC
jgi:hypothetical protein